MTNFQTDSILEDDFDADFDADLDADLDLASQDLSVEDTTLGFFITPRPQATSLDSSSADASECAEESLRDLPRQVPSITNSPRCAPSQPLKPNVPRRVRTVRVDAWAVPASANWSRPRTTVRRVSRGTRSTDWALPF